MQTVRSKTSTQTVSMLGILAVMLCIGCGGNHPATVTGEIRLAGETIIGGEDMRAQVLFYPTSDLGTPASALVDKRGRYDIATGSQRGLQPGEYRVSVSLGKITWPDGKGGLPQITELAPKRYRKSKTSGLVANVESGSNSFDFDIEEE